MKRLLPMVLLCLTMSGLRAAEAATAWVVDDGMQCVANCPTIQLAINAASSGDTIQACH